MTESRLSPSAQRRLDLFRHRKEVQAADRAAFETRRHHGLKSRQEAKLAHLATRKPQPKEEFPTPETPMNDAA